MGHYQTLSIALGEGLLSAISSRSDRDFRTGCIESGKDTCRATLRPAPEPASAILHSHYVIRFTLFCGPRASPTPPQGPCIC